MAKEAACGARLVRKNRAARSGQLAIVSQTRRYGKGLQVTKVRQWCCSPLERDVRLGGEDHH
jgi:hypothetical protein